MNDKQKYWLQFAMKMGSLTAFTTLAIVFECWWIIFFTLLFWSWKGV